jgi:hypothetical protein
MLFISRTGRASAKTTTKNSKQKLWLFVLYLSDLKFLKMAPGTHNVATNQINTIGCGEDNAT